MLKARRGPKRQRAIRAEEIIAAFVHTRPDDSLLFLVFVRIRIKDLYGFGGLRCHRRTKLLS
jgi:hypothetical protein